MAGTSSWSQQRDQSFFSQSGFTPTPFFSSGVIPGIQAKGLANAQPFFQPSRAPTIQLKCASCEAEENQSDSRPVQRMPAFESDAEASVQRQAFLQRMPAFESDTEAPTVQPKRLIQRQVESPEAEPEDDHTDEADLLDPLTSNGDPTDDSGGDRPPTLPVAQMKLTIGRPNDAFEQEADAVADQVVAPPKRPDNRATDIQTQPLAKMISRLPSQPSTVIPFKRLSKRPQIQRKETHIATASDNVANQLSRNQGGGSALDANTQGKMESSFGANFGNVRIHTGSEATQLSEDLGAKAFTHGSDIYFNEGQYNPNSSDGKHLLAHELTHTVQQGATTRLKPSEIQRQEGENEDLAKELAESEQEQKAAVDPGPAQQARQQADQEAVEAEQAAEETAAKEGTGKEGTSQETGEGGDQKGEQANARIVEAKRSKPDVVKPSTPDEEPKGEVGQDLDQQSAGVCRQGAEKSQQLADNQQAHDEAGEKLSQTESAVVPPAAEGQSRSNAGQVETLDAAPAPVTDPGAAQRERDQAIAEAVPTSIEGMNEFESEGKAKVVGSKVLAQTSQEVGEIQGTYNSIETPPAASEPEPAAALPEMEVAPETPQLNLGEGAVPDLQPEQTDASEFDQQSDQLLEKEGIGQEQLDMVDSGDLAEANKDRKDLKQKVKDQPTEIQTFAKQRQSQVKTDMQKEEAQTRTTMQQKRQQELSNSQKTQQGTKSKLELKRADVTKKINHIYETAKQKVTTKLNTLEKSSLKRFDQGQAKYSKLFEYEVKRDINAWKRDRYSGIFGGVKWLKDKIVGIEHFPEVKRAFSTARERYVQRIDQLIAQIDKDNNQVIQDCKAELEKAKQQIKEYVDGLGPELKKAGQAAMTDMQAKLKEMDGFIEKKKGELQQKLCDKKDEAIKAIDKKIEQMKEAMGGLLGKLGKLLLKAMIKFFKWAIKKIGGNSDQLMGILNKGESVIQRIVKDPIAFFKNIASAVGGGIKRFVGNIKQHLIKGLLGWLTGAMGDAGLQLPEKFDLKGIFSLMLQIFGLTWTNIRTKLAKRVGENVVATAEKGVDIIKRVVTEGPIALWTIIQEKATEIKTQVMEGIRNWAITQIVKKASIKLLSMLNPAGAIVQAIIALYDVVMFFIENRDRIIDFVKSIFNSIGEIAMGQVGKASAFIEKALAMTIPIILSFLARFLGLSGIGKAIRNVMAKVQKPVDKVVDRIVDFLAKTAKKLFKKKTGKHPTGGTDGKKEAGKITDKDRKLHEQYANTIEATLREPDAATKDNLKATHKAKEKQVKGLQKTYQKKLKKGIKLSITLSDLAKSEKQKKIRYIVSIKPNDLKREDDIDTDSFEGFIILAEWPNSINKSPQSNHLHFLKGQSIPQTLNTRISQVKGAQTSTTGDGKLSVKTGPNRYSYLSKDGSGHTVYLKQLIITSLERGEKNKFDAVVHEFDHAVRINQGSTTAFDRMKSEIFAFHAQMLTFIGTEMSLADSGEVKKAKFFGKYTVLPDYNFGEGSEQERLKLFFDQVYRENKVAKTKLAELVAFLNLLQDWKDGDIESIKMKDVEDESTFITTSRLAYNLYQ